MAAGDQHRIKAAELHARAQSEAKPQIRVQYENLAKAHLRLAAQADVIEHFEVVDGLCRQLGGVGARSKGVLYEPPRPRQRWAIQTERNGSEKRTAKLGNVLYWLGRIIAALIVGVAIALYVNEGPARSDDLPEVGFLILVAAIVWAIGKTCQYVLSKT
jgi:hypothetical protein